MDSTKVVDTEQAAKILKVESQTLRSWRAKGKGPTFYRVDGHHIRYAVSDLKRWASKRMEKVEPQKGVQADG